MAYALGFCSRTGSAVAVAVDLGSGAGGAVLAGRWTVDLTAPEVPSQLFHAAAGLPPAQAEALVWTGVTAVGEVATDRLRELQAELGLVTVVGVVTGDHPVPESVATILAAHTLMHAAEGQLYRDALLEAAAGCGLTGHGLPKGRAAARLGGDLADTVTALGAAAGPPWRKEHKLAAVAALAGAGR